MKRKKRSITLMEIMIVILLIGLISSVVGYNMKGSLDKGKAFKSKQGAVKIKEILEFEALDKELELENFTTAKGSEKYVDYLIGSGLFKDRKDCLDGWEKPYLIKIKDKPKEDPDKEDELVVESPALQKYEAAHRVGKKG
jgi:competence protein ComGC